MKTRVLKSKKFLKQIKKAPIQIKRKVSLWVLELAIEGLRKTRTRPGYHDEPLEGKRQGHRSIRLSKGYRLIYKEIDKDVYIELLEVNKHDY